MPTDSTDTRARLPITREGRVHKIKLGTDSLYVVVNTDGAGKVREVFGHGDGGCKPELDGLCGLASIGLQYGAPLAKIVKFLRKRNYPPHGGPGQPKSISDALATVLDEYVPQEEKQWQ